jgi:dihydroorotate dehydrogenase electron transfer subunit
LRAEVAESRRLHGDNHRILLRAPEVAGVARPGQFVHVWVHAPEDVDQPPGVALLRRPYSISRLAPPDGVEIVLRARGVGGRLLAAKREGDVIDLIGPLGRGFEMRSNLRTAVIVAGGIGLAPIPFLVQTLASQPIRVVIVAGAAHDQGIPYEISRAARGRATVPELEALGAEVTFVAESVEGLLATSVLEVRLAEFDAATSEVMAVGPRAMLKRLAEITEDCLPLQVSLEERMACGVGACRSCVVPTRSENGPAYRTVCRDGPVFRADEIDWVRLEP